MTGCLIVVAAKLLQTCSLGDGRGGAGTLSREVFRPERSPFSRKAESRTPDRFELHLGKSSTQGAGLAALANRERRDGAGEKRTARKAGSVCVETGRRQRGAKGREVFNPPGGSTTFFSGAIGTVSTTGCNGKTSNGVSLRVTHHG